MNRRSATALCLLAAFTPFASYAQARVYRLGVLDGGRARPPGRQYDFVTQLAEHGFVEGTNLQVQHKAANFEYEDLDRLARELVQDRPDVIVAMGPSSIAAAAGATRTVPIVMMHSGDPVALGLVSNLARPGGNITGNGWEQDVRQVAKTIDLLRQIAPKAARIGLVWHLQNKSHPLYDERFRQAAAEAKLQVVSLSIRRGADAEQKIRDLEAAPIQALIVLGDYITFMYHKQIDAVIKSRRLPTLVMGRVPELYDSAIVFYGPRMSEYPARTAEYIARIFKGARPGDLPIVLPSRWEIAVSPKAASAMGVAIPHALRLSADELIE